MQECHGELKIPRVLPTCSCLFGPLLIFNKLLLTSAAIGTMSTHDVLGLVEFVFLYVSSA